MGKNKQEKFSYIDPSSLDVESLLISKDLDEIEKDICHLQPFSYDLHRKIALQMHHLIMERMNKSSDENEKIRLKRLSILIKMKVKF